jgi:hypothetical protein
MRTDRVAGDREQPQREPSGAPSLGFEIAFVLGCLAALFFLYRWPRAIDLLVAWLA